VLDRLESAECAAVLRALLDRHPELAGEAEEIARRAVTDVDAEAVADEVEEAILSRDLDELDGRAGRKSWGYVDPSEAAWEILEEALDPFVEQMKRHVDLGFEAAATSTCEGIVLGLCRCRGHGAEAVLGYAEDFPAEAAGNAIATLKRESRTKYGRAWRLPDAIVNRMPEWAEIFGPGPRPQGGR
jgi:hypothetical protein